MIKSFNFISWNWSADFDMESAKKEIDYQVERCNVNTITFAFAAYQEHCYSTEIKWKGIHMPDPEELSEIIKYAKSKSLKVIVKPMLDVEDGYWRAYIRFFDEDVPCEPKWSDWFKSYYEYLLHYGKFCEDNNVDIMIIGCELVGTDSREKEWRKLVELLREEYHGQLTYNCDKYQEHNVKWWDCLDYISSSGYYPKGTIEKELDRIEKVVQKYNKPFFFAECGCPSILGASKNPNDWTVVANGTSSEDEQYEYYKEFLENTYAKDFVNGFCFWDWPVKSPKSKEEKYIGNYSIKFKKAENLICDYFGRDN
ncbi:MAG: 1,4-beta-xylanase [Clostridium butyricum]|nr:1,4-beta-xylanase [Clostridium butyricum]